MAFCAISCTSLLFPASKPGSTKPFVDRPPIPPRYKNLFVSYWRDISKPYDARSHRTKDRLMTPTFCDVLKDWVWGLFNTYTHPSMKLQCMLFDAFNTSLVCPGHVVGQMILILKAVASSWGQIGTTLKRKLLKGSPPRDKEATFSKNPISPHF